MAAVSSPLRLSSLRLSSARSSILALPRCRQLSTLLLQKQKLQPNNRWRNARWNSSAAPVPTPLPELPTPPDILLPDTGTFTDLLAAIPPLEHGGLKALGLCHWTPAGLIQYSFELINVVTGLPWFHTIIVGGIFWRLVIFPFAAAGLRNAMRMRTVSAESAAISETMAAARAKGDTVAMMRASEEAKQIRAKAGVSLGGMMAPMIQLPISLGLFLGLKKMCDLPVAQLTQSGLEWLPDLTVSGPYYILPTIVALSGNLQIMANIPDTDFSRPATGHLLNLVRVVSVSAIFWMDYLPSGVLVALAVMSTTGILQTYILRNPAVRSFFSIPQRKPLGPDAPKMPTLRDTFDEWIRPRFSASDKPKVTPIAPAYVPPGPVKFSTPPTTPRVLEVYTPPAQSSSKSSGLFEDPPPKAASPPLKAARAAPKPKAKPRAKRT